MIQLIKPVWPAPSNIIAGVTTRRGGVCLPPYDGLNLATHVADDPIKVNENRHLLNDYCRRIHHAEQQLTWHWLEQTHSTTVSEISDEPTHEPAKADAAFTTMSNQVCVVLTADCLPILVTDRVGSVVAAVHAGWRGLCNGIISSIVSALCRLQTDNSRKPKQLISWLGPAIGSQSFEVGEDVRRAFLQCEFAAQISPGIVEDAFTPLQQGKYLCDLYRLATLALTSAGVKQIYGGGFDTYEQDESFYSYRRDGVTGRMASFIYIVKDSSARVS